ncbi:ATP phosphoribosyltransferase [Biomaibacter acetigenes]|uniref:ATP phosphoribosyltransferase n=1 Tax=Biomaibacter acetigenes TaxID=2316383 RepID=UPI001CA42DDA|nr:ATP phosphoribosyltransferase [Biomaibacter acetigenes]MDN5311798.1 phosphoribosyltransferase [Thermoanaerobacteraceae bacterium]
MEFLTIALSKGRILGETMELFNRIKMHFDNVSEDSRKLVFEFKDYDMRLILSKPTDVPTFVEHGVADLGVAGKDVLLEDRKDVFELLDLKLARCRMVVAVPEDRAPGVPIYRVATKYPHIAESFFLKKAQPVEIIKLNGSVELGPLLGLSDAIVDIVATGHTLRENHLKVEEVICPISARLIANQVSFRLKSGQIQELLGKIKAVV